MAVAAHHIEIYGNRFGIVPNSALKNKDGTDKSALDHVVVWLKETGGAFRELQLFDKVCRAASMVLKEMGSKMSDFFADLSSKLSLAWAMLTIPRLPSVTQTAWKAIENWGNPVAGPIASASRDVIQKVHDIADATASWGYGISLIFGDSAIKNTADVPDLVSNVADLSMAVQDYEQAKLHLEYINKNHAEEGDFQQRFLDTMREALMRVVKSVASVASGVLGLLVLAFGGPVLPAWALLALSLTSTVAAVTNHFFKETRTQEKVEFFKFRSPAAVGDVAIN